MKTTDQILEWIRHQEAGWATNTDCLIHASELSRKDAKAYLREEGWIAKTEMYSYMCFERLGAYLHWYASSRNWNLIGQS